MSRPQITLWSGVSILMLSLMASAADAPADDDAAARKQLVGTWTGYVVDGAGEHPDRGPVKLELVITEKSMHGVQIKGDERVDHGEGTFTLSLSESPKFLDARGNRQFWNGIYTLDGDTLKWCVGKQRPKTFESSKGQFLMILKRQPAKS
jgi:uncharacterized protein (TIGR03067 family)